MAASNADVSVTTDWQDLVVTYAGLAGASAYVQNKGPNDAVVFFGGASEPAGVNGVLLQPGEPAYGTADHIWVRGLGGSASIGSGLNDAA